ncbi:hypothetical protein AB0I81_22715 [Nonomuraea sp. NPDC050404]|uniref:hypothetical protein n=1 Tax=Nonomuraea sp. NPDC050404 TaxID=3155783 RepID=UPI0033C1DFFA
MSELRERPGDQPLPTPNEHADIQSQVIADIEARRDLGIQRYGTALQPHNGRDALRDLYEELVDGAMYVKQVMVERATAATPVEHGRRIHAVIFNAVTEESRALDRFLSLTDRDKVTAAVVAALAAHGYAIKQVGGAE